ncbi:MAG: histidine kinase dimerization/phospho-acceptor domain-containing protein [Thalassobaculum sp.]
MDISQAQDSKVRVPPPLMSRYPGALSAMAVAIPAITAILLVLAINRIQTTQLESDAVTRGRTWSSALLGTLESVDTVFGGGELSRKDRATIALASRIGGLEKFIIFNADGVAIAASDPADIGSVNRSDYWTNQVLRGGVHATIERQAAGETTGGSAKAAMVVAETYVPVFAPSDAGRHVIGAFETYLDVTESARSYERIGFYASAAGIALIAAAAAIALAFARRTQAYRREREAMLAAERQTAESANRAKSAFLATVSHEIRTPMTGILATIELLEGSGLERVPEDHGGYRPSVCDVAARPAEPAPRPVKDRSRKARHPSPSVPVRRPCDGRGRAVLLGGRRQRPDPHRAYRRRYSGGGGGRQRKDRADPGESRR